jgi:hypothetical protein
MDGIIWSVDSLARTLNPDLNSHSFQNQYWFVTVGYNHIDFEAI